MFIILNSCIYSIHVFIILNHVFIQFIIFEFMYLFNSCIYYFLNICTYYFLLLNCFYVVFYLLLFQDMSFAIISILRLNDFIYNPKELKLSSRKQYK